jgi:hypothetical protein
VSNAQDGKGRKAETMDSTLVFFHHILRFRRRAVVSNRVAPSRKDSTQDEREGREEGRGEGREEREKGSKMSLYQIQLSSVS